MRQNIERPLPLGTVGFLGPSSSFAPTPSKQQVRIAVIVLIVLVAACLRLYDLPNAPPGLFNDEAMNGINAMEIAAGGKMQVFYPENNGREGLFINVQGLFVRAFQIYYGDSFHLEPWMLRLPSAIFGILTVVGIFFLVRLLTANAFAAAVAASLLATSVWHINFSRIGLRAITSPFWLVWALVLLIHGFSALAKQENVRNYSVVALAGIFYGAGFHSYISYRVTPILIALLLYWFARDFRSRGRLSVWAKAATLFSALTVLLIAPLAAYAVRHPDRFNARIVGSAVWASPNSLADLGHNIWKTLLMLNVAGDPVGRHNVPGRPELFLPVGLFFLLGMAVGVRRIYLRAADLRPFLFCLAWAVLAVLPSVLTTEGQQPHALRCILLIVPAVILAAMGATVVRVWLEKRYPRRVVQTVCILFALMLAWEAGDTYFNKLVQDPLAQFWFEAGPAAIGEEMAALPDSVPKYVFLVGLPLDSRGNPAVLYEMPLLSGGYNPQERLKHGVHFVTDPTEARSLIANPPAGARFWRP